MNWKAREYGGDRKTYPELPDLTATIRNQIILSGWLTTGELAKQHDIPETTVRNACTAGRLPHFRFRVFRVIEPEDAEAWIPTIGTRGRHKDPYVKREAYKAHPTPYDYFLEQEETMARLKEYSTSSLSNEELLAEVSKRLEVDNARLTRALELLEEISEGKYTFAQIIGQVEKFFDD